MPSSQLVGSRGCGTGQSQVREARELTGPAKPNSSHCHHGLKLIDTRSSHWLWSIACMFVVWESPGFSQRLQRLTESRAFGTRSVTFPEHSNVVFFLSKSPPYMQAVCSRGREDQASGRVVSKDYVHQSQGSATVLVSILKIMINR